MIAYLLKRSPVLNRQIRVSLREGGRMKAFTAGFAFLLGLWLAAPAAAQSTTLRVGFNGFYGAAPFYLGQDAGIFRKQNIALEMVFIAGGSVSTQALLGKSLDILLTGG